MKRYTFEITVDEGNNEFWEEILEHGKTGCDEILEQLAGAIAEYGFEPSIKLVKFEDK